MTFPILNLENSVSLVFLTRETRVNEHNVIVWITVRLLKDIFNATF